MLKRSSFAPLPLSVFALSLNVPIGNLGGGSPFAKIAAPLAEPSAEMTQNSANIANK